MERAAAVRLVDPKLLQLLEGLYGAGGPPLPCGEREARQRPGLDDSGAGTMLVLDRSLDLRNHLVEPIESSYRDPVKVAGLADRTAIWLRLKVGNDIDIVINLVVPSVASPVWSPI